MLVTFVVMIGISCYSPEDKDKCNYCILCRLKNNLSLVALPDMKKINQTIHVLVNTCK